MLTRYNLKMPRAVYGGENAMENITGIIKALGARKVAMFTDPGIEKTGLFALPEEAVKASGVEYYVLDDLKPEPDYMTVQKLIDDFKAQGADLIVACGGGSVMDAAKLASVLVTDEYGVKELLDEPGRAKKCVPIVLIPTTAGTGAEVTPNAIVAVPERELKVGIVNDNMIADYVILDARMIKNLPRKIAAATGVDALSYPLGGKYHIAHGVSNAILLVPVMKFNEPVCRKRFAECYDRCAHDGSRCETEEEKSAWIIRRLDEIVKHLEIPTSLSRDFGVPEEDLEGLVQAGMQVTRLLVNNMREITPDDARQIYKSVL